MNEHNTEGRYLLIVCEKVFKIVYIKNLQKKKEEKEKQREREKEQERERGQKQKYKRHYDKKKKDERGRGRRKEKELSEFEVKVPILFIYRRSRKCYEKLVDKNKIRKKKKKYGNIINELIIDNIIGSVEIKNEFFLFVVEKWRLLNKFYYLNKYRSIYKIEKVYFVPYNINIMSMNTVVNNALNVDDSSNNFFINAFENTENIGKHFDIYDSNISNNTSALLTVENDNNFSKLLEKNSDKSSSTSKNVGTVISNNTSNNISATTFEPFDGIVNTSKVSFSNKVEFSDFVKYNAKENEKELKEEKKEFMEMTENCTHIKKGKRNKHMDNYNIGNSGNNLMYNNSAVHTIVKREEKERDRDRDKNKKLLTFNSAKRWLSNQFNHKNILNIISDITSYENKGITADNEKIQRETKYDRENNYRNDTNWNPTKSGNEEMLESNICESTTEQKNEVLPQGSSRNQNDEIGTYSNINDSLNSLNDLEKSERGDEARGTHTNCLSILKTEEMKTDNDSINSNNNFSIYQNLFNRLSEGETPFSYGKVDGKKTKNENESTGEMGRKNDLNERKSNYVNCETSKNDDKRLDSKMDMHRILRTIQKLLTIHMYYSYDFDLTQSVQRKNIKKIEEQEVEPLSIHSKKEKCNLNFCEKKFVWNFEMIKKLKNKKKIDNNWFCSIIQGYISYTSIEIDKKRLELLLISRRSTVMGGTRFNKRGINDDGYVANFIETEQIIRINTNCGSIKMPQRFNVEKDQWKVNYSSVKNRERESERNENCNMTNMSNVSEEMKNVADLENRIISIVQIRGSVPLFWEQHSMSSHVNIQRSALLSIKAFKEHNKKLIKNYGNNIFYINLLSEGKSNEKKLIKKIVELMTYIKRDKYFSERDYIHYIQYDFHTAVKNRGFEDAMNYFINKVLMKYIKQISFYMENGSNGNNITNGNSRSSSVHNNNSSSNNSISNSNKMNEENEDKNRGNRLGKNKGKYQEGIFRTNCLDCLDRTNVFQYYYCWFFIVHILNTSQNEFFLKPFQKSKLCFYRSMNSIFTKDKIIVLTTLPIDSYWMDFSDMYILDRKVELNNKGMIEVQPKNVHKDTRMANKKGQKGSGEIEDRAYGEDVRIKDGKKEELNETQRNPFYNNNRNSNMGDDSCHIAFSVPRNEEKKENGEEVLHIFKHLFKKMWVENGDAMSTHYTGTGSVFSSQVNFGKSSLSTNIDHAIKSIERFYQNNFEDNFRQECIDIILCNGKYKQQIFPQQDNFEYFMNFRRRRGEHRSVKLTDEKTSKHAAVEYSNHRKGRKKIDQEIKEKNTKRTNGQTENEIEQNEKEGNDSDIKSKQEKYMESFGTHKSDDTSDSDETDSDDSGSDESDENDSPAECENEKDVENVTLKGRGSNNKGGNEKDPQNNLRKNRNEKEGENRETREYDKKNKKTIGANTCKMMEAKDKKAPCNSQHEEEPENVESSFYTSSSSSTSSTVKSKEHGTEDDSVNSNDLQSDTAKKKEASRDCSKKKKMNEDIYDERIIKLWIGSWNLCGNDLYELNDISSWLNSVNELIDIYVFCFQEVVELTGFRVLMNMKDKYKEKKLEQKIVQSLSELSQRQKELYQKDNAYYAKREQKKRKFYAGCNYSSKDDTSEKGKNTYSVPFNADQNYFQYTRRQDKESGRANDQQKKGFHPSDNTISVAIQSNKGNEISSMPDLVNDRGYYNLYPQADQMTKQKEKGPNTEIGKENTQTGKVLDILEEPRAKMTHENELERYAVKHGRKGGTYDTNYVADMEELQNYISKHKEEDSSKIDDSHFLMPNVNNKWKEDDDDDDFTFHFAKRVEDVRNGDPFNRKGIEFEKNGEKRRLSGVRSTENLDECDAGTGLIWNKMKVEDMLEIDANHITTRNSGVTDWKYEQSIMTDIGMKESESEFSVKKKCDTLKGISSQGEKIDDDDDDDDNNNNNNNRNNCNTTNTTNNNNNNGNNYKDAFSSEHQYGCHFRKFKYVKLKSVSMIGLFILIFIDEGLIDDIREIEACKVKVGLKGNTGNKGSVSVKFRLGFNSFCFNNIHLASGQTNIFERNSQMQNILSNTFQNQDLNNVFTFDYFFACGDFNFRINKGHDEVVKLIEKNKIKQLLSYDQFIYTKMYNILPFCLFCEHPVSFNPTYKYKKNSNMYDVRRTPAWCDRILISGKLVHLSELERKKKEFGEETTSPFLGVLDESYNMYQANTNREMTNSSDSEQRKYCEYMRDRGTRFKKERRSELTFREKRNLQKNRKSSDCVISEINSIMKHGRKECNDNSSDGSDNQQYYMYNDFYENEKIYFNYESYKTHNNFFSSDHKPISAVINLKVFFDKTKQEEYDMMSSIAFQSFADTNNMRLYAENNDEDEMEDDVVNDVGNSDAIGNNENYDEKGVEMRKMVKMENSEKGTVQNEEYKNNTNILDYIFPNNANFTSYTADSVAQFLNYANEITRGDVEHRSVENERERRTANIFSSIDNDILKGSNEDAHILEKETQKENNGGIQLNSDSGGDGDRYNKKERERKTEREKRESWPNLIDL